MTEEVVEGGQESVQEVKLTPIQEKALDQGWKPKEQFEGDESEFIDAAEFVRRGELFQKIEHQSKELKSVKQALEAFKQHHSKVAESEYNRALKSLQESRKQAFVDGETEKAFAIEEQIEEVKAEKATAQREAATPAVQELNPEFVAWTGKNPWYQSDRAMRSYADSVGLDLARQGFSPSEVLRKVEEDVRKEFAHKFTNPKRDRPNAVEGTSRGGVSVQRGTVEMDSGEREVMRKLVRAGALTEAEYMVEFKRMKGL